MMNTLEIPGRILIVKPDEIDLLSMTDLLQSQGYQCTLIQDQAEIIEAFETNEYDLAIIEIQKSDDKEMDLIQAIQRSAPGLPVIIFTRHPSLQPATISILLPVFACLIKPVQPSVLLRYVKAVIANYKASKRRESLVERTIVYAWAIEETIQVLEATRSSFKSTKLAALRRQLERILEGEPTDHKKFILH